PGFIGHGNERLALGFVWSRHYRDLTAQAVLWKSACERVFDRRQADHLATDLGEAFQASANKKIAVRVHGDDVARIVPTIQAFEFGVGVFIEIAAHDIRSAHHQTPAVLDAFDRLEFVFHAGQEAADGAAAGRKRRIDTDAGRAFG